MKFRVTTLLLVVAFISAWLATVTLEMELGHSLRQPLWAMVFAMSLVAVLFSFGRQRAFFTGVFVILAMRAIPPDWLRIRLSIDFDYVLANYFAPSDEKLRFGLSSTIELVCTLALGLICGLFAVAIYNSSRKQRDADSA